jgi:hypothetical protein
MAKKPWYRESGEKLPPWYCYERPVISPHKQATIDHFVYDGWLVAFRLLKRADGKVVRNACADARFMWLLRQQVGLQERMRIAVAKNRSTAVKGWVNIALTDAHKDDIMQSDVSVETMLQDIGRLVFLGYRFSLTFDDYSSAQQATLVCANPDDGNYEYGLSARHPDPVIALTTLLYKHALTADTGWREFSKAQKRDDWG